MLISGVTWVVASQEPLVTQSNVPSGSGSAQAQTWNAVQPSATYVPQWLAWVGGSLISGAMRTPPL